jgi:hypothetical protein
MSPKAVAQRLLDVSLIKLIRYILERVAPPRQPWGNVFDVVTSRAAESSADYVEAHLDGALLFPTREQVWDYTLSRVRIGGLFAEFGVHMGGSINHIARAVKAKNVTVYGFDSFEGLKEDWRGTSYRAGHFTLGGRPPDVLPNVRLIKGWFDETVPRFLADHAGPFSFIHLDAVTFESTELVLSLLRNRIVPGTIIIFDEYLGFPNWQNGEWLAWRQFVERRGLKYRYLAFADTPAAVEVL